MSDDESAPVHEEEEAPAAPSPAPPAAASAPAPASHDDSGAAGDDAPHKKKEYVGDKPRKTDYNEGKPSKLPREKLMMSEGIVPIQAGTNKFASQKGQTGFGVPRDVVDKIKSENLKALTEEQVAKTKELIPLQSGTNKYASQKGMTGFRTPRDVLYKPKGTGGAQPVSEEKAKITEGIIPLQSGTNKLASQAGITGFGMPRLTLAKYNPEPSRDSQAFIHLQMGTNRFANQNGMTGFGMPRLNVTHYTDKQRGELPHDETTLPRQTSAFKDGASQAGSTGFGAFRSQTSALLEKQDRKSQGLIPYQYGINWGDSMSGKTGFGMPRHTVTNVTDDTHPDLPESLARSKDVPMWTGVTSEVSQAGMTAIGMPRDVKGNYLRRLW